MRVNLSIDVQSSDERGVVVIVLVVMMASVCYGGAALTCIGSRAMMGSGEPGI